MLHSLAIRNFVVIDSLELEFGPGFTVITGETGAGKSILLDALDLVLGERFETATVRPGRDRAELAAEFSIAGQPLLHAWLNEHDLAGEPDTLLVRRVLDSAGKSRAYINGRPVTVAQLRDAALWLVDIHGQHAHQSLLQPTAQRELLDSFGGFTVLAREVAKAWQHWQQARAARERAARDQATLHSERDSLRLRAAELGELAPGAAEWAELTAAHSRLANAASLIETARASADELADSEGAVSVRLAALVQRLRSAATHDPALAEATELLDSAAIGVNEAARFLRGYLRRLDVDPAEFARVESRLAALHAAARKYRVQPAELPQLATATATRLAELTASVDDHALERAEDECARRYDELATALSGKRRFAATELAHRVGAAMQELAMTGGSLETALVAVTQPASYGRESVEFRVSTHPQQPSGPLARVASGGELSRVSLAIQVVTSEVGQIPTLVFDEVDVGIGGGVAEVVGRRLQELGVRRQVICVTHLPQVAACADHHYRVYKSDDGEGIRADVAALDDEGRVGELARMLGGVAITDTTRAHARELLAASRRGPASAVSRPRKTGRTGRR